MKLAIIAVPGYVVPGADGKDVIAALGGENTLAQLHRSDAEVSLNLSFHPNRSYVIGRQDVNGKPCILAIRVKRWSDGRRTVEIMGVATKLFTFTTPADFIHIANVPVVTGDEVGTDPLNRPYGLVPPFFTKIGSTVNLFKEQLMNASQDKTNKIENSHMFNAVAHFDDDAIPTKPMGSNLMAPPDEALMAELEVLFNQRPVWLRNAIDEYLPKSFSTWKKKVAFARTCYIFADGPWRGCMCKLGYDPRKHRDSHIYQIIDFRDPYYRSISWKTEKHGSTRDQTTDKTIMATCSSHMDVVSKMRNFNPEVHFLIPPSRPSQLYQFCDIFDAGIQKLVNEQDLRENNPCSKATGWYSQSTMSKIRSMMNVKSLRMRQSLTGTKLA